MRSKMWQSGRKERQRSVDRSSTTCRHAQTLEVMFPCVSNAPLGSPVVPEV